MIRPVSFLAASLTIAAALGAQQQPPIRPLGPVVARSTIPWTAVLNIRALPGSRVLVHDLGGRKLVLLDSTLAHPTIVADTTAATATAYSGRVAGLIAYRGDSTLFVDPQSMSMMVIDANGKIARVMSVPRAEDAAAFVGPLGGAAAFDAKGRLVYRAPFRFRMAGPPPANGGLPSIPSPPDSSAILRVDLATRQVDTIGFIKVPKINMQVTQDDKGNVRMTSEVNPLPVVDDFAVLADGSIAILRGRDYHVDFVNADGTKTSAPKVPFDWQRLSDEDKIAFIDSVKAARAKLVASLPVTTGAAPAGAPAGAAAADGARRMVVQFGPGGDGPGPAPRGGPQQELAFVAPSELPDYKPPFFAGAARADAEGNLWVRTIPTRQIPGGPVYDVINRNGALADRVQLPVNTTILGFGPGGDVYLLARDGTAQTVERARVR
jgi:hypothetical protein